MVDAYCEKTGSIQINTNIGRRAGQSARIECEKTVSKRISGPITSFMLFLFLSIACRCCNFGHTYKAKIICCHSAFYGILVELFLSTVVCCGLFKMNVEQLISEVFSRPALWNQKHKSYHNRVLVEKLWMSVASEMKIPKEDLKKKWKYLRDQFRCEIRKIPTPKSGDAASEITSSWPYFNSLQFLKDQMKYKNISDNLKPPSIKGTLLKEEIGCEHEDILGTSPVEETRDLCDNDKFSSEAPSKKYTSNSTAKLLEIEKRKLALLEKKNMEKNILDEDEAFFVTLLPHIRKLDPQNKFLCRMEIQDVLYKYVYAKVQNMPTMSNESIKNEPLSSATSVSSDSHHINALDISTTRFFPPISYTTIEGTNIPSTTSSLVPQQNATETVTYSSVTLNSS